MVGFMPGCGEDADDCNCEGAPCGNRLAILFPSSAVGYEWQLHRILLGFTGDCNSVFADSVLPNPGEFAAVFESETATTVKFSRPPSTDGYTAFFEVFKDGVPAATELLTGDPAEDCIDFVQGKELRVEAPTGEIIHRIGDFIDWSEFGDPPLVPNNPTWRQGPDDNCTGLSCNALAAQPTFNRVEWYPLIYDEEASAAPTSIDIPFSGYLEDTPGDNCDCPNRTFTLDGLLFNTFDHLQFDLEWKGDGDNIRVFFRQASFSPFRIPPGGGLSRGTDIFLFSFNACGTPLGGAVFSNNLAECVVKLGGFRPIEPLQSQFQEGCPSCQVGTGSPQSPVQDIPTTSRAGPFDHDFKGADFVQWSQRLFGCDQLGGPDDFSVA